MHVVAVLILFCAWAGAVSGASLPAAEGSSVCNELCSSCGAEGFLIQQTCVCVLPQKAADQATLEKFKSAQTRADAHHMPLVLQLDPSASEQPPISNHLTKRNLLRRWKRHAQAPNGMNPDLSYYGPPILRPFKSPSDQAAVYEIVVGNSNEDTMQLVFPQSVGLDVKHEYLYETPDGVERPYSDYVRDMDHSDEASQEYWATRKDRNSQEYGREPVNQMSTFSRTGKDNWSAENREESDETLWSSEAGGRSAADDRNEDGYDELSNDYDWD